MTFISARELGGIMDAPTVRHGCRKEGGLSGISMVDKG